MRTQISLILLGLGLSCGSSAYAAHGEETPMPLSNEVHLTAPDQSAMWSFGLTGVLMEPTNKAFVYASDQNTNLTPFGLSTAPIDNYTVKSTYHQWFAADVTYAFAGNGRDVTLAYEGLYGNDSSSVSDPNGNLQSASNNDDTFIYGGDYDEAEGKTDVQYDAVDLVFGQKLNVGQHLQLHPFMGLRYAYIATQDKGLYSGGDFWQYNESDDPIGDDTTENFKMDNTFTGIGPRVGSDASVILGRGFSIHGRLGVSALIGSQKSSVKDTFSYLDDGTLETAASNFPSNSNTVLIPEVDARLGINYKYNFDTTTDLDFEAGWQATNYFNVISDQAPIDIVGAYLDTYNFGLQGPYVRVQLDMA